MAARRSRRVAGRRSRTAAPGPGGAEQERADQGPQRAWLTRKSIAFAGILVTAIVGAAVAFAFQRFDLVMQGRTLAGQPLLTARAEYNWSDDVGEVWATTGPLSAASARRLTRELDDTEAFRSNIHGVAAAEHAVKLGPQVDDSARSITSIRLSLTTSQPGTVLVENIAATHVLCRAPLGGSIIFAGAEGIVKTAKITVDIDHGTHQAMTVDDLGPGRRPYFDDEFITVGPADPQVVEIDGITENHYCTWDIDITASTGDRHEHLSVQLPGARSIESSAWRRNYIDQFIRTGNAFHRVTTGPARQDIP